MTLPKTTGYLSFLEIAQYIGVSTTNISLQSLSQIGGDWNPPFSTSAPHPVSNFYGEYSPPADTYGISITGSAVPTNTILVGQIEILDNSYNVLQTFYLDQLENKSSFAFISDPIPNTTVTIVRSQFTHLYLNGAQILTFRWFRMGGVGSFPGQYDQDDETVLIFDNAMVDWKFTDQQM